MYLYIAMIIDDQNGEVLTKIFSYSEEGLLEEMGKKKWKEAVKKEETKKTKKAKKVVKNLVKNIN